MLRARRAAPAVAVASAALLVLLAGCASAHGPPRETPEGALHRYAAAVKRGDLDAAYSRLGPGVRARTSREAVGRMLEVGREDMVARVDALAERAADGMSMRAAVPAARGGWIRLERESGGWYLDASALSEILPSGPGPWWPLAGRAPLRTPPP